MSELAAEGYRGQNRRSIMDRAFPVVPGTPPEEEIGSSLMWLGHQMTQVIQNCIANRGVSSLGHERFDQVREPIARLVGEIREAGFGEDFQTGDMMADYRRYQRFIENRIADYIEHDLVKYVDNWLYVSPAGVSVLQGHKRLLAPGQPDPDDVPVRKGRKRRGELGAESGSDRGRDRESRSIE